jgi:hypothetical protein
MEIKVREDGLIVFAPNEGQWEAYPRDVTVYKAERYGANNGYYALSFNPAFGAWEVANDIHLGDRDDVEETRGLYLRRDNDFHKIRHVLNWTDKDERNRPISQFDG